MGNIFCPEIPFTLWNLKVLFQLCCVLFIEGMEELILSQGNMHIKGFLQETVTTGLLLISAVVW